MPDITMCKGGDCPLKEYCERHTATPCEYRQSYFVDPPYKKKMDGTDCAYYMSNRRFEENDE